MTTHVVNLLFAINSILTANW